MSWRPTDWKRPHRFVRVPTLLELVKAQDTDEVRYYQNEFYELGADAMLKALRVRPDWDGEEWKEKWKE